MPLNLFPPKDSQEQLHSEKEKYAAASLKLSKEISSHHQKLCPFLKYRVHHTYEDFKYKSEKSDKKKKRSQEFFLN